MEGTRNEDDTTKRMDLFKNNQLMTLVGIWKIEDSLFEGWGDEGWVAEDLSPVSRLNAGGR